MTLFLNRFQEMIKVFSYILLLAQLGQQGQGSEFSILKAEDSWLARGDVCGGGMCT